MNQEPISPLTLIAVFAGVIEASALASLPFLSEESQEIYTWFLVGFPFFLTVLFFLTLNFNTGSLFTPDKHDQGSSCATPVQTASEPSIKGGSERQEAQIPDQEHDEPMIIAISGPDSRKLIERHVLRMIARPQNATRRWVLYNLDTRACIHFSVGPMTEDQEASFIIDRLL
ncbi:MAG: hypothetical protein LBE53_01300 [Paucimonas sp.]|nr:hypothetical protein [Paucimonas sp.]